MTGKRMAGLLAALLVAACGGGSSPSGPAQLSALKSSVEVTFWHALSGNLQAELQTLTNQFNSSQTTVHVTLVALTGFAPNMNHIVLGTDDLRPTGMILGFIGIAVVLLSWVAAHYISWYLPRGLQHAQQAITEPVKLVTLDRLIPRQHYTKDQISPHFWPNGKMPVREDWKQLAADGFKSYKLTVSGMVNNPVELSIDEMRALGAEESITMHHCIQGWSGVAQWRGISMRKLIELVKPKPYAKVIAFYSFGGSLYGGAYYDTQQIHNAMKPECMLAFEMNGEPLPAVYGAPLRLRVENQLGYKMVKWIERIEFVESEKLIGEGEGGKNEGDTERAGGNARASSGVATVAKQEPDRERRPLQSANALAQDRPPEEHDPKRHRIDEDHGLSRARDGRHGRKRARPMHGDATTMRAVRVPRRRLVIASPNTCDYESLTTTNQPIHSPCARNGSQTRVVP